MCGEHLESTALLYDIWGSSPHMRGTLLPRHHSGRRAGIIPACAGNTFSMSMSAVSDGDHPRMCGDHADFLQCLHDFPGSSPHVRGTPSVCNGFGVVCGIIPACAGNTFPNSVFDQPVGDHPRMCGEHPCSSWPWASLPGSSPHVRGTRGVR